MALSDTVKLARVRQLFNRNKKAEARRKLAQFDPEKLGRYDRGLYYFLRSRFDYADGNYHLGSINHAIRLLKPEETDDELYHWCVFLKGVFHRRSHRFKKSTELFRKLKADAARCGHYHVEASATGQLARHMAASGKFSRADRLFEKAIERYHFQEVRHHRRAMIHNRAMWLARYGRFGGSEDLYYADPVSVDELKEELGVTYTINHAFNLALRRKTDQALDLLETYFERSKSDKAQRQTFFLNKGVALLMANRYEECLSCLSESLDLALEMHHETIATVYKWLAVCHVRMGDYPSARRCARQALRLGERNSELFEVAGAHFVLGYADAQQCGSRSRLRERAEQHIVKALRIFGKIDARWDLAMVQYSAAQLGIFGVRQNAQLVRLALRYFASEKIEPPVPDCNQEGLLESLRGLREDDRDKLRSLLDLD